MLTFLSLIAANILHKLYCIKILRINQEKACVLSRFFTFVWYNYGSFGGESMSSIQSLIIIAIILIVILVIAFMLIMNRRQLREIIAIDDTMNKIGKMHLGQDIDRLDKMDLAGESLTTLKTWRKSYQEASTKKAS